MEGREPVNKFFAACGQDPFYLCLLLQYPPVHALQVAYIIAEGVAGTSSRPDTEVHTPSELNSVVIRSVVTINSLTCALRYVVSLMLLLLVFIP